MHWKRNRRSIWFIKTPNHQPQSFGDFGHGYYFSRRPYTKLTYSFSYYRSKGTSFSLPHQSETRRHTTCERSTSFTRTPEKHKLCLSWLYYTIYNYNIVKPKGTTTTKPTAYSYRRQWNPCHMDFWSCLPASH